MRKSLLLVGFVALGCPLLVDDRLTVVPADSRRGAVPDGGANAAAIEAGSARACGESVLPPSAAPQQGMAPALMQPGAAQPAPPCPAVCDRCEAGRCIFECQGQDVCRERTFSCPSGLACLVKCAAQACGNAIVSCPQEYDCNVECTDQDACKNAQVQCDDGNCNVRCTRDKSCDGLEILCGSAQCGAECLMSGMRPRLDCGSACSCDPC